MVGMVEVCEGASGTCQFYEMVWHGMVEVCEGATVVDDGRISLVGVV